MTGNWVAAAVAVGQWFLFIAGGIFVSILVALVIYVIRNGERDDSEIKPAMQPFGPHVPTGRSGITFYKGIAKLKVLGSRVAYISMESLVNGTATREQWAVVAGIQVLLVTFWLFFLGVGLMYLPNSRGLSLFFPGVVGIWFYGIVSAQLRDHKRARRKRARLERIKVRSGKN